MVFRRLAAPGRQTTLRTFTVFATLALVALAPSAASSGYFWYDGVLRSGLTDGYALTTADNFQVHNLPVGAQVRLMLAWETPDDMRITAIRPGGSCQLTPAPDLDCIVGGRLAGTSVPPACPARASRANQLTLVEGSGFQEVNFVTDVKGTWGVSVHHAAGASEEVPYQVRIEVQADGWQTVSGPARGGWTNTDAACWTPQLS